MNHPNREEWMSFLYEETDANDQQRLSAHLASCEACRQQVQAWRGTMKALDQWPVATTARRSGMQPWVRWAAAAAVFLAAGLAIGASMSRPSSDLAELKNLRKEIEAVSAVAQSQREVIEQLTRTVAENRTRDKEAMMVTLRELEAGRAVEMRVLRKDLETVAALTEESLNNTQNQLVRLAGYSGDSPR